MRGYLQLFELSKVNDRPVWYRNAVLHEELSYVDELHIFDIFVLELFVQTHLVIGEDMFAHMQCICGVACGQVTREVGEYLLDIAVFRRQCMFFDEEILVIELDMRRVSPVLVKRVRDIESAPYLFPKPIGVEFVW